MANRLFFSLMAASSALALLRGFILAALLSPDGFGRYAMLFAIGTFAASLLSFGMIERSFKRFPRLVVDGHADQALTEADRISKTLALRAAAAAAICIPVLLVLGETGWVASALLAAGVAFSVGWQSIYISLQRAEGDLAKVGVASISRTILALALGAIGALIFGWQGSLLGEIFGGILGGVISRHFMRAKIRDAQDSDDTARLPPVLSEQRELWTFAGFLGASVPLYLDRSVVATMFGHESAGTYAVLMLFVMGCYTATSIVSQKLGPQLIRMERGGAAKMSQLLLLARWSIGLSVLALGGMAVAGWALIDGPLQFYSARYGITWPMIGAAAVLAALQVTHLSEWFLLAYDRESNVFSATMVLLVTLAMGVAYAALASVGIVGFIWLFALAKALQFIALTSFVAAAVRRR